MLKITIPQMEFYDDINNEFIYVGSQTIALEHSLVSISKWESKWKKPFLSKEPKTREQTLDYIRCMTITQNVNPLIFSYMPDSIIEQVNKYIDDSMTATWFKEDRSKKPNNEVITSEVIYYWMVAQQIPFECQKWHLNRLLTLIQVCNEKNKPPKKMSKKDIMANNRKLNAARRKKFGSSG